MDQKWFIWCIFGILCFLNFPNVSFVNSHTLSNTGNRHNEIDSNAWEIKGDHVDLNQDLSKDTWKNFRGRNDSLIPERRGEDGGENRKWLNVLTFDKLYNSTEKEKGSKNETKITVINEEDHLKIFENEDDDEEEDKESFHLQEGEHFSHFLSPESFLAQIISEDRSKSLERTKRQAENGKRRCRCRRKRRRGMVRRRRRRRRRNRVGQQQRPARRRRRRRGRRRNGRRRGKRRCVCRKKGDDGGKSGDGENPDVEEADGEEEGTTEGGDESTTEEGGGEGEEEGEEGGDEESDDKESDDKKEGEEEEGGENEEGEGSDEESDEEEEEEEEEEDAKESPSPSEGKMPTTANSVPTYVFPYPNMVETPIMVMPGGGVPVGSFPTSVVPTFKVPSYPALGALLPETKNPKTEN